MRITGSFARGLTLAAIGGIKTYYEAAESGLQAFQDNELAQIRKTAEAQHWEYSDWAGASQEHEMTFDMLVPNYFRYSCVVLLYLIFESKLKEMCEIAHKAAPDKPLPEFGRDFVGTCKRYLRDAADFSTQHWGQLEDLSKLRNCIVHASGRVGGRYAKHIASIAETGIGIHISGAGSEPPSELLPLYLDDNQIMIEPRYCRWIIKTVYEFFEELCDALSLPAFSLGK